MCSSHGFCRDNDGSYECQCLDGFEGDGYECSDIDECELGLDWKMLICDVIIRVGGLMLPSKRPLYMGNILNVALKIGNINFPTPITRSFSDHLKKFMTAQNSHFAQTT